MFERFTDQARRAVVLAQDESRRLDHRYIGSEHVLLGLLHGDDDDVAASVLASLGVHLDGARDEVVQLVGRGEAGRRAPRHIPFNSSAKKVLERSLRSALDLKQHHIGTGHLLLGLVADDGEAVRVLTALGADPDAVRGRVRALLVPDPGAAAARAVRRSVGERVAARVGARGWARARVADPRTRMAEMVEWSVDRLVFRRFTVSAARALLLAESEAMRLGDDGVGVVHLLLGLVVEDEGRAARALAAVGVDLSRARAAAGQVQARPADEPAQAGYDDDLLDAIERALAEALMPARPGATASESDEQIDTQELLAGILRQAERADGPAARVLAALDVAPAEVRAALDDLAAASAERAPEDAPDQGRSAGAGGDQGEGDDGGAATEPPG
jgi:ATP-dependent Clp protease ATP-binding subunit ClpA